MAKPIYFYREVVDDYKIIRACAPERLEDAVKEFLRSNHGSWVLCGGISCGSVGDRVTCYTQAIKKVHYEAITE